MSSVDAIADGEELPWRGLLRQRLRGQPYPLLVFGDRITPAGSLWAATRLWTQAFRDAGLKAGDRVVIALPASTGFLAALLAGLWDGLSLALAPPGDESPGDELGAAVDCLDTAASVGIPGAGAVWEADACGLPLATGRAPGRTRLPATPDARFLLRTSGTSGAARWVVLSDANVLAVLASHAPVMGLTDARLVSVLPWYHVFGLVIDLLPALLAGAEIVRDETSGRDPQRLASLMRQSEATHLNCVPLTTERLLQARNGAEALQRLRGGVVGGAPVDAALANALARTRLRVGYGQTEASPGISLGAPGRWAAGCLGRPLGCEVRVDDEGSLSFAGPNACLGVWTDGGLERLRPDRWVDTGDIVRADGEELYFVGRADSGFKLSNGRLVAAGALEAALRAHAPQMGRRLLLHSPDGDSLELVTDGAPGSAPLSLALARSVLGGLGSRLAGIRRLPPDQWALTPKGDVDRRATLGKFDAGNEKAEAG